MAVTEIHDASVGLEKLDVDLKGLHTLVTTTIDLLRSNAEPHTIK
jgi:hypothetical protein